MDAVKTACGKRTHKFKWEERLTDEQCEFVGKLHKMIWYVAKRGTPRCYRKNELAHAKSYDAALRSVIRSSKTYSVEKGTEANYAYAHALLAVRNIWKMSQKQFDMNFGFASTSSLNLEFDLDLSDLFASPDAPPDTAMMNRELVEKSLASLADHSQILTAVRMHFGIDTGSPETATVIGNTLGVSRSTAHNLVNRGLKIMRKSLRSEID